MHPFIISTIVRFGSEESTFGRTQSSNTPDEHYNGAEAMNQRRAWRTTTPDNHKETHLQCNVPTAQDLTSLTRDLVSSLGACHTPGLACRHSSTHTSQFLGSRRAFFRTTNYKPNAAPPTKHTRAEAPHCCCNKRSLLQTVRLDHALR